MNTGRKLNVKCPGRLANVLCMFNLCHVSRAIRLEAVKDPVKNTERKVFIIFVKISLKQIILYPYRYRGIFRTLSNIHWWTIFAKGVNGF